MSSTFLSKYGPTCQDLCSSDDEFLNEHPEICSTFEEPESLEEIVKKCANLEYYKDNKEKCEVVEKIDLILEDQDSASNQKADIVDSIKRQTEKERKNIKNNKGKKKTNTKKKDKVKKIKKIKKSKCNKPKYASINPKECKKVDIKSVIAKKCKKKKYKSKHRIRCASMGRNDDTSTGLTNEVIQKASDKRCRKESFR